MSERRAAGREDLSTRACPGSAKLRDSLHGVDQLVSPCEPLQVAELAVQFFISNDKPNVAGLVLAGSADFKNELSTSEMFDQRLQAVVVAVVDVSYGGDNGFNQARPCLALLQLRCLPAQRSRGSGSLPPSREGH